jgi:hypothetical protein
MVHSEEQPPAVAPADGAAAGWVRGAAVPVGPWDLGQRGRILKVEQPAVGGKRGGEGGDGGGGEGG